MDVNKIGFRMRGGMAAYDELMTSGRCRLIAMSVFASGALPAQEALEYVCRHPGVESIVFGASCRHNILQTMQLIDEMTDNRHGQPIAPSRASAAVMSER